MSAGLVPVEESHQDPSHMFGLTSQCEARKTQQPLAALDDHLVVALHVLPPGQHLHVLLAVNLDRQCVLVEVDVEVAPMRQ